MCSGYSACISVLEIVWVWHGTGSTPQQREHATKYAKALTAGTNKQLEEVEEGHEDESIWMFLGREAFAHADYWRFRRTTTEKDVDPRIWRVDHAVAPEPVSAAHFCIMGEAFYTQPLTGERVGSIPLCVR